MNKKNFDMMLNKFAIVFERVLNRDAIAIYWDICSEIPDSQTNTVIRNCLKKCQFFPKPADIFKSYDETAMETRKSEAITMTEEERERNLQRIRKAKEDLKRVKMPTRISSDDLNINNYKEINK
jgi:hypothetical protein